jgi:hypothetical protein
LEHDLHQHAYFTSQSPVQEVKDDIKDVYTPFVVNQE